MQEGELHQGREEVTLCKPASVYFHWPNWVVFKLSSTKGAGDTSGMIPSLQFNPPRAVHRVELHPNVGGGGVQSDSTTGRGLALRMTDLD